MLGIVEIPHLRWRLRRQLLHEEQLEAATLAPSPRQADAGEGTGGEEAAGPIAAAAGAARVAGWLARPLTPSLPPATARRSHPHTHSRSNAHPARPAALQAQPLKETRTGSPPAASRRASPSPPTLAGAGCNPRARLGLA